MDNLTRVGRIFFGICLAGIGIQQFQYGEFRPVIVPDWPAWLHNSSVAAYIFGAALVIAGAIIAFASKARNTAIVTGLVLFVFFLCFQVINQLFIIPYQFHLGLWTDALKELALVGGCFVMAASYPPSARENFPYSNMLLPVGRIFYGLMLALFGIDHFLYTDFVSTLVPSWIPGKLFWTYVGAIALIGGGLAMISKFKLRYTALLLAIMLFVWFVILHIPRAIADPAGAKGNEITSVFEALGFSGIALVISALASHIPRRRA